MRNIYIVSYDIADPKRLRSVFKTMLGLGDHIQLSVFRCELSERDKVRMIAKIDRLLHHDHDQVLLVDVGPARGRAKKSIAALGLPYAPRARAAVIV